MVSTETQEYTILNIFQESFSDFGNRMCGNRYHIEKKEILEDEISMLFYVSIFGDLFFKVFMKKQKAMTDKIPNIKEVEALKNKGNPYTLATKGGQIKKYTDESYILSKIYDYLIKHDFKEIVCYEKHGILISDPFHLDGIYNINVKCIMGEEH